MFLVFVLFALMPVIFLISGLADVLEVAIKKKAS